MLSGHFVSIDRGGDPDRRGSLCFAGSWSNIAKKDMGIDRWLESNAKAWAPTAGSAVVLISFAIAIRLAGRNIVEKSKNPSNFCNKLVDRADHIRWEGSGSGRRTKERPNGGGGQCFLRLFLFSCVPHWG